MNEPLFSQSGAAVLITDLDGCILSANGMAGHLFAYVEKQLLGRNARELLNSILPDHKLTVMSACPPLATLPVPGTLPPLLLSISEIQLEKQSIFVIVLYAIPEQDKAVSLLKTRFIALASHEFRSPLSSIQLSAALIERYFDRLDRDKVFAHLHKIRLAVGGLTGILEDFLCLERMDTGKPDIRPEEIDLPVFADELIKEMRLQAREGQQFLSIHRGDLIHYPLDRKMFRLCLTNLLSNAIKYSGADGLIELSSLVSGRGCIIRLTDNGLGIPQEDQQHIFEPFFRAGNVLDRQGTGLGLSIAKRCCELLNGSIDFESVENQGTVFILRFPAQSPPAVPGSQ